MKIKDIFSTKIEEKIDPVVKVADLLDEKKVTGELGSYVVTPSIEKFFERFFEDFTNTFYVDTEEIGVWVSGYFGSGKSYLAKIMALLIQNREIDHISAIKRFDTRLDKNSPYSGSIQRHLSRIPDIHSDIYAYNINTLVGNNDNHLAQLLLSHYYQNKGYSSNIIYAHVIERELDKQGKITDLHHAIEEFSGKSWNDIRANPTFYRRSFYQAACKVAPNAFRSEDDVISALSEASVGQTINIQTLIEIVMEDLRTEEQRLGKRTRTVFVLDEIGQWIGDNLDRLYHLQALAEEAAIKGKGRIWLIVTTHEDMSTIIETAISLRPDTKKIESRFRYPFSLTTENIELVLQDRLLKKNIQGKTALEELYNINSGMLRGIGQLADSTQILPSCTLENFVAYYPFLPYHIHIIPDIVKSLRSQGGRGEQLSGSTRTLLAITQDIIRAGRRKYLELELGELVTFDEVFENLADDGEIHPDIRSEIKKIEKSVPEAIEYTRKVAEVLYLVRELPYVLRTSDNISRLLIENTSEDLTTIKPKVENNLVKLIDAEMVAQAGNEYEFLTGERRNFEKEVRTRRNQIKHQDRQKGISQFASQVIGFTTIDYKNTEFDVKTFFDGSLSNKKGDVEIRIFSPYAALTGFNISDLEERSLEPANAFTIYILSSRISNLDTELNYYLAMQEVINTWKGDPNRTQLERSLATDREKKELQKIRGSIISKINEGLGNCHIIHKGQARAIVTTNGQNVSNNIREEISKFWPNLYSKFDKVPVKLRNERQDILDVLLGQTRFSAEVKKLKIFDANNQIDLNTPLLDELRRFLITQESALMRIKGDDMLEKFTKPSYGWDAGVVRVGVAALLRNGNIRVLIKKKLYENLNDSELQAALRNIRQFDQIEIEIEKIDVSLDTLINTREALIRITGNKKIEETLSGISEAFENLSTDLLEKTRTIEIWATPADFSLHSDFVDGKDKIEEIVTLPNNARKVDEIYINIVTIENGYNNHKLIYGMLNTLNEL